MQPTTPAPPHTSPRAHVGEHVLALLSAFVDQAEQLTRHINQLEFLRATCFAQISELASAIAREEQHADRGELMHRTVEAEVAAATQLGHTAASTRMAHAHRMMQNFPRLAESFQRGEISMAHASTAITASAVISHPDGLAGYDAEVSKLACTMTAGQLKTHAKRAAEAFADRSLDERHEDARAGREIRVIDLDDGMAQLTASIGAVEAYAIRDRLTRIAHLVNESKDDTQTGGRTLRQIQADVFTEILLTGGITSANAASDADGHPLGAISARVQVSVPVFTLMRGCGKASDRTDPGAPYVSPAELAGYGPIPTDVARKLAGYSSAWDRVLTHPIDGAVLAVDRYRPNEDLKRFLGARDMHCRFPGCLRRLDHCDIDHTIAAANGGATSLSNLGHLCRKHHVLKHWRFLGDTGWKVRQRANGVYEWTSPLGREYRDIPKSSVRFRPRVPF